MKVLLLILCFFVSIIAHSARPSSACNYKVLEVGTCGNKTLQNIKKAAVDSCLTTSDANSFALSLQSELDTTQFSALAVYDANDIGFMICLDGPCYVMGQVGPVGLFAVFVGGPCNERSRVLILGMEARVLATPSLNEMRTMSVVSPILAGVPRSAMEFYRGQQNVARCIQGNQFPHMPHRQADLDELPFMAFADIHDDYGIALVENGKVVRVFDPAECDIQKLCEEIEECGK